MDVFRYRDVVANIDERIGKNLARYRGEMSQRELANRVRAAGLKWTHLTVASIERGERPLRASESVLLMQLLDIPNFDALLSSEDATKLRMLLVKTEQDLQLARSAMIRLKQHYREMMAELGRIEGTQDYSELDSSIGADLKRLQESAEGFADWMQAFADEGFDA